MTFPPEGNACLADAVRRLGMTTHHRIFYRTCWQFGGPVAPRERVAWGFCSLEKLQYDLAN
ncbi:hypothetical protein BH09SUM1_BH09SUM1_20790 [soil metagenome]